MERFVWFVNWTLVSCSVTLCTLKHIFLICCWQLDVGGLNWDPFAFPNHVSWFKFNVHSGVFFGLSISLSIFLPTGYLSVRLLILHTLFADTEPVVL